MIEVVCCVLVVRIEPITSAYSVLIVEFVSGRMMWRDVYRGIITAHLIAMTVRCGITQTIGPVRCKIISIVTRSSRLVVTISTI
jgi:hypothetical protein